MMGSRGLSDASAGILLGILDSRDAIKTPKHSSIKKEILQLDAKDNKVTMIFNVAPTREAIICNLLFIFIYKKINLK